MTSVTEHSDSEPSKERKRISPPPGFFLALGIMFGVSFGLLIDNLFNGILAGALISGIIELRAFAKRQS